MPHWTNKRLQQNYEALTSAAKKNNNYNAVTSLLSSSNVSPSPPSPDPFSGRTLPLFAASAKASAVVGETFLPIQ